MFRRNPLPFIAALMFGWHGREMHRSFTSPFFRGESEHMALVLVSSDAPPPTTISIGSFEGSEMKTSRVALTNQSSFPLSTSTGLTFPYRPLENLGGTTGNTTKLEPNALTVRTQKCNEKNWEGAWPLHHRRMKHAQVICDGVSRIKCVVASESGVPDSEAPPAVQYCWVENLFTPASADALGEECSDDRLGRLEAEPPACRFVAYCRPSGLWAARGRGEKSAPGSPTHSLFRSYGNLAKNSPFGRLLVDVESDGSKWPAQSSLSSASSSSSSSLASSSSKGGQRQRWAYISVGDCAGKHRVVAAAAAAGGGFGGGRQGRRGSQQQRSGEKKEVVESSFNPGHCHADPLNAAYVTHLLERYYGDDDETAATVHDGGHGKEWVALLLHAHHYFRDNAYPRPPLPPSSSSSSSSSSPSSLSSSSPPPPPLSSPSSSPSSFASATSPNSLSLHEDALEAFPAAAAGSVEAARVADRWPVFAVWYALFRGKVLTREEFFHARARPPLAPPAPPPALSEAWAPLAPVSSSGPFPHVLQGEALLFSPAPPLSATRGGVGRGGDRGSSSGSGSSSSSSSGGGDREVIEVAALSPNGFTSTWWAHANCRASRRSPVVAHFRSQVTRSLDALAQAAWREGGVGGAVLAKAVAKHWPPPQPTPQGLLPSERGPGTTERPQPPPPPPHPPQPPFASAPSHSGDWLTRGDLIVMVDRASTGKGRGRALHNADAAWATLVASFGERRPLLRVVSDARAAPYLAQYALWRSAALVVGVHGGNLAGSLWLSPGQALLEVGFRGCATSELTQYAHVSASVGARYRCVPFKERGPNMKETGGTVDPRKLVEAAAEALS